MFYAVTFRSAKPQMAFGFPTLELAEVACLGVAMVDDDDTLGLVFDADADRLIIDPDEWRACYDEAERGQADADLLAMTQSAREFTPTCEVYKTADGTLHTTVTKQEE